MLKISNLLEEKCNIKLELDCCKHILCMYDTPEVDYMLNLLSTLVKKYTLSCRYKNSLPTLIDCISYIKFYRSVEMYSLYLYPQAKAEKIRQNWTLIERFLCYCAIQDGRQVQR